MTFLNQTSWNAESNVVWKELVSRFGQEAYDDETTRVTHQATLEAEYDAHQYSRSRVTEYPAIGDQLDALFHAGVFPAEMAAEIQAVKDKYPK